MPNQWSHQTIYGTLGRDMAAETIRGFDGRIELARPMQRWLSGAIDYLPLWVGTITAGVIAAYDLYALRWWPVIIVVGGLPLMLANSVVMQGITGQSLGKRLLGTAAYRKQEFPDGWRYVTPGIAMSLVRFGVHVFEWLSCNCLIGVALWCLPFFNKTHRLMGDLMTDTYVAKNRRQIVYRR